MRQPCICIAKEDDGYGAWPNFEINLI